ncbi:MAG: hypothetical protein HY444_02210, partial [Nitrospirae bacterium]|nr:hypothetical protein [Nitrospirota bacterium]
MNSAIHPGTFLMSGRMHAWAIMTVILLASVFPVDLFPNAPHEIQGADGQYSGKQGQVLLVQVRTG